MFGLPLNFEPFKNNIKDKKCSDPDVVCIGSERAKKILSKNNILDLIDENKILEQPILSKGNDREDYIKVIKEKLKQKGISALFNLYHSNNFEIIKSFFTKYLVGATENSDKFNYIAHNNTNEMKIEERLGFFLNSELFEETSEEDTGSNDPIIQYITSTLTNEFADKNDYRIRHMAMLELNNNGVFLFIPYSLVKENICFDRIKLNYEKNEEYSENILTLQRRDEAALKKKIGTYTFQTFEVINVDINTTVGGQNNLLRKSLSRNPMIPIIPKGQVFRESEKNISLCANLATELMSKLKYFKILVDGEKETDSGIKLDNVTLEEKFSQTGQSYYPRFLPHNKDCTKKNDSKRFVNCEHYELLFNLALETIKNEKKRLSEKGEKSFDEAIKNDNNGDFYDKIYIRFIGEYRLRHLVNIKVEPFILNGKIIDRNTEFDIMELINNNYDNLSRSFYFIYYILVLITKKRYLTPYSAFKKLIDDPSHNDVLRNADQGDLNNYIKNIDGDIGSVILIKAFNMSIFKIYDPFDCNHTTKYNYRFKLANFVENILSLLVEYSKDSKFKSLGSFINFSDAKELIDKRPKFNFQVSAKVNTNKSSQDIMNDFKNKIVNPLNNGQSILVVMKMTAVLERNGNIIRDEKIIRFNMIPFEGTDEEGSDEFYSATAILLRPDNLSEDDEYDEVFELERAIHMIKIDINRYSIPGLTLEKEIKFFKSEAPLKTSEASLKTSEADEPAPWMNNKGKTCTELDIDTLASQCNSEHWKKRGFCRKSCNELGSYSNQQQEEEIRSYSNQQQEEEQVFSPSTQEGSIVNFSDAQTIKDIEPKPEGWDDVKDGPWPPPIILRRSKNFLDKFSFKIKGEKKENIKTRLDNGETIKTKIILIAPKATIQKEFDIISYNAVNDTFTGKTKNRNNRDTIISQINLGRYSLDLLTPFMGGGSDILFSMGNVNSNFLTELNMILNRLNREQRNPIRVSDPDIPAVLKFNNNSVKINIKEAKLEDPDPNKGRFIIQAKLLSNKNFKPLEGDSGTLTLTGIDKIIEFPEDEGSDGGIADTFTDYKGKNLLDFNLFLKSLLFACLFYILSHKDSMNLLNKLIGKISQKNKSIVMMVLFSILYYIIVMFI